MNLFDKLFVGDKGIFDIPVDELRAYLKKLGNARTDTERSYKQYLGQCIYMTKTKRYLLNVSSAIIGIPLSMYYILRGLFMKKKTKVDAICRSHDFNWMEIIPDSIANTYQLDTDCWYCKGSLHPNDWGFFFRVVLNKPFHPYFILKITYKLAKYSAMIHQYSPSAIIVHDEFSFTSSIMSLYCEKHGVKHINVQHGEKLFYLRDSFFRFTECYVWDEHYKNLFIKLKAEPNQFIIEKPLAICFNVKEHYHKELDADFKYYLAIYDENEIASIVHSMEPLIESGKKIIYRPHPNYSDIPLLKKYVKDDCIEYSDVHILDSIASTRNVVGEYSTVLSQAYFNGINVILDDVTYKNRIDSLSDFDYILSSKVKERLSKYQKN